MEIKQASPKYHRVLLKLSGEALAAGVDDILNYDFIRQIASVVKKCQSAGVQVALLCYFLYGKTLLIQFESRESGIFFRRLLCFGGRFLRCGF